MKYQYLFVSLVLLGLVACSDDSTGQGECPINEVRNPVTGDCEPDREANNSNNKNDMGTDQATPDLPLPSTCEGDVRRCNQHVAEICVDGMFQMDEVCAGTLVCVGGYCIPGDGDCEPGATRCAPGLKSTEVCQADGKSWASGEVCESGQTCAGGECSTGCAGLLDEKSNIGCEYITMRHLQVSGSRVLPHSVVVSNPGDQPVEVIVTTNGPIAPNIAPQTIAPLDSAILEFPVDGMVETQGISTSIYKILSSRPVIATQFAPLNNPGEGAATSDATLLLPTNAIGKEYVVLGWQSLRDEGSYIDIVATEDDTTVNIASPVALNAGPGGSVAANASVSFGVPNGKVLHVTDAGGGRELSGVRISSDKPVAVFTGAKVAKIPDYGASVPPVANCLPTAADATCVNNDACCSGICGYDTFKATWACVDELASGDHIEQQLFPVESWGTSYIATPFTSRGINDFTIFRVAASEDNTLVTLDPPVDGMASFTLNRGEYKQIKGTASFEVSADKRILVAQFMLGGAVSSSNDGDPAFMIPPAIEQYRDTYVFMVPGQYANNFVTLIKRAGSVVMLDGNAVEQALFQSVGGGSTWEVATINTVVSGVHRASSNEGFAVIVHGSDYYISYAFAGGIVLPD